MNSYMYFFATMLFFLVGACQAQDFKSVADYKAEAAAAVSAIDVDTAKSLTGDESVVFVDVREGDEVDRLGEIEGSVHVPRGVLEFYIDRESTMHMDVFSSGKRVIFYCATGGRSLLAAKVAKDMGVADPVYLDGGYSAWTESAGEAGQ